MNPLLALVVVGMAGFGIDHAGPAPDRTVDYTPPAKPRYNPLSGLTREQALPVAGSWSAGPGRRRADPKKKAERKAQKAARKASRR